MSTPTTTTVDDAEAAWLAAQTAPVDAVETLLHPEFVAIHSAIGLIQDRDTFVAGLRERPPAHEITTLSAIRREFGDTVVVSSLQQIAVPYVPGELPFSIQAVMTRVWVRAAEGWLLGHLQMSRRFPPG